MQSLFISIPAYKDSELLPTLKSLFLHASGEYSLHPFILLQEDKEVLHLRLKELQQEFTNINVIPVDIKESKGPCWARHWLQQFITHQEYYLQLDSHHRFVPNWDKLMVEQLLLCPPKSLLTSYPAPYEPPNIFPPHHVPTKLIGTGFDDSGILNIEGSQPILNSFTPLEGNLIAGGYILAPSNFCIEVPYDPQIYFKGEEVSLAVRAWTSGWNIFHPSQIMLYHYYTRKNVTKHWDDNTSWVHLNNISLDRIKTLLNMEHIHPHVHLGIYGLGSVRTLEEYQSIFGIDFKNKVITPKSLN